jgi:hypothetical protein
MSAMPKANMVPMAPNKNDAQALIQASLVNMLYAQSVLPQPAKAFAGVRR